AAERALVRGNHAPVLDDDLLHDGETEPGAVVLRRDIGVEDAFAALRGDPGAVVVHVDDPEISGAIERDGDATLRARLIADGLRRIADQVDERSAEHLL